MAEDYRRAGALREKLLFQSRSMADDGFGSEIPAGAFETRFTQAAAMRPRTGGSEGVDAARLGGKQPYVVTIRNSPNARNVTVAWQIVDARNPIRVFAITSPPADPDGRNHWLEFLCVDGQAS